MAQNRHTKQKRKTENMEQADSTNGRSWRQPWNKLKHPSQFSKPQLAVFVLAFALIGYLLFKTFAAAPVVATLQAEQMTLPAGGSVITDATSSAGKAVKLTANGAVSGSVSFPSTVTSLTVMARGDQCSGAPTMTVALDGTNRLTNTAIASTTWSSYTYTPTASIAAGTHNLSISFTNSYSKFHGNSGKGCARVFYADVTNFYGPTPAPTPAPTVALNASPTSVTAGQASTLTWNSTNATSCMASGAWSGTEPTSGSTSTGAINQTSTYTLTCTGAGGSATASATVTVSSPPPTSGGTPGIGVLNEAGYLTNISNPSLYSMVVGGAWSGDVTSVIEKVPGRGLVYFNGSDIRQSFSTGVTYTDALNNGWLLLCGTSYCTNSTFSSYGADLGSSSYQQKWIANVESYLVNHPGVDGIFIDNVLMDPKADFGGVYPNKYPDTASWSAATLSFVKAVYSALHSKGYYVAENVNSYKSGDTAYNDGTSEVNWWKQVGPYADGLMNEWYDETSSGITTAQLRATGTAWYQQFDGWQRMIGVAQAMGKNFIGLTKQTCTNTTAMTYTKASFLLEWNGGGSVYMYTCGGNTDPTNAAWTKDIGTPSTAKVQVGVGWMRSYTKGTVLVNPSPTVSQTFTVNGTSYTLAPTTARIL
jgi:hypothetical protein